MAFTRNSSTREDYAVEQCAYLKRYNYHVADLGFVVDDRTPGVVGAGFGVHSTTNMPRNYMARNAVDVESVLRGIRANDFVRGKPFAAEPDNRDTSRVVEFFERPSAFTSIAPIPCVNPRYQERERPDYH